MYTGRVLVKNMIFYIFNNLFKIYIRIVNYLDIIRFEKLNGFSQLEKC